jgi:hypothetical protein
MKFLSVPVFIISLAIGLFIMYIQQPDTKCIYVYPTPENLHKYQWNDSINNCYEWEKKKVDCASYSNIRNIPVQN